MSITRERLFGGIFGLIVGDALGFPFEGLSREYFKEKPVTDMVKPPWFEYPLGTWSDDTSLTLCTIDSLCRGYDLNDIANNFCKWLVKGYWSPLGFAIGIGRTTFLAIRRLLLGYSPRESGLKSEFSNGNGSLMRILPIAFYFHNKSEDELIHRTHEVSAITHAHPRTLIACGFYVIMVRYLLNDLEPYEAYLKACNFVKEYYRREPFTYELKYYSRLIEGKIQNIPEDQIYSTGYVVHTLEASIWCFLNSKSYKDAVLRAVNLGGDTDTIAAVTGGLAGTYYGYSNIPDRWLEKIVRLEEIINLIERFYERISLR